MVVKIIRRWYDKKQAHQFGTDDQGNLYCRELKTNTNLTMIDPLFKKGTKVYYKFINPKTQKIKYVERTGVMQ